MVHGQGFWTDGPPVQLQYLQCKLGSEAEHPMARSKGYGQFCPVAQAAEVLAERWTPLVVRELLCGSVRFNDLQRGVPRMSSSLLSRRLKELQRAGILERRRGEAGFEYHLTTAGKELFPLVESMGRWAQRWLRHDLTATSNLDPNLLMWDIRRNVAAQSPGGTRRFVAEFQFSGVTRSHSRYWLVFDKGLTDLCFKDRGFEVDLIIHASLRTLTEVWLGHITIKEAMRDSLLSFDGAPRDVATFRSWFSLSIFAPAGRAPTGQSEPVAS
jgi:DNA-binding HxlR family transcriptional regulator